MSQQKFATDKDIKKVIRRAQKQGWIVTCGPTHIRVSPPTGQSFLIPSTPGSQERIRRAIFQFRRAGLK